MAIRKHKESGVWWVDITPPGGKRVRRSTGTKSKREAQEYHDQLRVELWRIEKLGEKPKRSFEEGCVRFLQISAGQADYRTKVQHVKYWREVFGGKSLCSITADDIYAGLPVKREYEDGRAPRELSAATKNRYLASIRRIFSLAQKADWIDKVPNLTNYREPEVRVRWITKESARSLIENVHLSWMQDVCEFALHTGARANEILTLEWDNVDLDAAVAWIINSRAKSGRGRSLPLNTEAISLLRRRKLAGGQWVFTRSTGNPALEIDRRVFNSACEKTGISNFRFHDLRHTWASWHVQAGTPLFVLKELGGWETLEMVKKYAHLDASHLAGYVNQGTFRS